MMMEGRQPGLLSSAAVEHHHPALESAVVLLPSQSTTTTAQPWRPKHRERPLPPPPPPDSPSVSTRISIGYDSESRVSSPDKPPSPGHLVVEGAAGDVKDNDRDDGDTTFREMVLEGVASKSLVLILHEGSCGGTYWVCNSRTRKAVAIFKPADEEIGQDTNPHGNVDSERVDHFAPGTGFKREILAYRLDYERSAGVPHTIEITINGRVGSLQRFVDGCSESADHLPGHFSTDQVHRIALLDLRLLNGDRHGGNILVKTMTTGQASGSRSLLVPIDHSYIAPSGFSDPELEWMYWPQTKQPFSAELVAYVARLDAGKDRELVDALLHDEEASEVVFATTTAIKLAVSRGYTARDIAVWFRRETLTQPSQLEHALAACRRTLDDGGDVDIDRFTRMVSSSFPPLM